MFLKEQVIYFLLNTDFNYMKSTLDTKYTVLHRLVFGPV